MRYLRENTATRVTVGPFLDVTDGITPETALTVTGCHMNMSVDEAGVPTLAADVDLTASGGDNDMVHITNDDAGLYDLELTAAQTNYNGRCIMSIFDTDVHLPVFHEFMIVPANVYDSIAVGSDDLDVQLAACDAGAIDAAAFASDTAVYLATINVVVDAGGTPDDTYACSWFKNGVPVTSGITLPKVTAKAVAAGTTKLIDGQTMTADGSYSGTLFYAATGAEIMTPGVCYVVVCEATIDGANRTMAVQHVRDTASA